MRRLLNIQLAILRIIRQIKQRRLMLVLSLLIGLLSGMAAILLKNLKMFWISHTVASPIHRSPFIIHH